MHVRVLKVGTTTIDPGNLASPTHVAIKHGLGIGGGSTVSLIREGHETLLVDSGFEREADVSPANLEWNRRAMAALLALHDLTPADITRVFVTHFHRDHFGGLEAFPHATWLCHRAGLAECPADLRPRFAAVEEGAEVVPRTVTIHTPGHTPGHASVVWTNEARTLRIAIAGDAILDLAWLRSGRIWKWNAGFAGVEAVRESERRLLEAADLVIPGHGQPFFTRSAMAEPGGRAARFGPQETHGA